MIKFSFMVILGPVFVFFISTLIQISGASEMNIVIMGDFGYSEERSKIKKHVVAQIKKLNNEKKFDFGLILGDNVYPNGAAWMDYDSLDEVFNQSFPKNEFNITFLTILGNHGYLGDISTQISYSRLERRFYMPHRYYKYDITLKPSAIKVTFICADTTPLVSKKLIEPFQIDDIVQRRALESYLSQSQGSDYVFFLNHHNAAESFGPHTENGDNNVLTWMANKYNLSAVIAGHNHNMQYIPPGGIRKFIQLIVGSSAKLKPISTSLEDGWYHDKSGGFATMMIKKDYATFKFIDEHGNILKEVKLNKIS